MTDAHINRNSRCVIMEAILKCNSCNIVVNELLTFVMNKLDVMDEESLCNICVSSFSSEDIKKSKELLFQSIPIVKKKINRRKHGKERRDIDDIIGLVKITDPDALPVFVARDLHRLPPVTFDSVDVTCLLKDLVMLKTDIQTIKMKYATVEQLEIIQSKVEGLQAGSGDRLSSSVGFSNVNVKRGAYMDSGPIGLTHVDFAAKDYLENSSYTEMQLYQANASERVGTPDSIGQQRVEKSLCGGGSNNSASAIVIPSPRLVASPTRALKCKQPQTSTEKIIIKDRPVDAPLSHDGPFSSSVSNADGFNTTYANVSKSGEWKTVERRTRFKTKNRFIGRTGKASADPDCKFIAAESKIPIFISNVHKDTSEADIIKYIRQKTQENVNLQKIDIKDKNKCHNAFILYVHRHKLQLYLDEEIWPAGIIFRRFVSFKHNGTNSDSGKTVNMKIIHEQ